MSFSIHEGCQVLALQHVISMRAAMIYGAALFRLFFEKPVKGGAANPEHLRRFGSVSTGI